MHVLHAPSRIRSPRLRDLACLESTFTRERGVTSFALPVEVLADNLQDLQNLQNQGQSMVNLVRLGLVVLSPSHTSFVCVFSGLTTPIRAMRQAGRPFVSHHRGSYRFCIPLPIHVYQPSLPASRQASIPSHVSLTVVPSLPTTKIAAPTHTLREIMGVLENQAFGWATSGPVLDAFARCTQCDLQ